MYHFHRWIEQFATLTLQIEEGGGCPFDYLTVGSEKYCGSNQQHIVYSFETVLPSIPVVFRSDGSVTDAGFALQWYYSGELIIDQ